MDFGSLPPEVNSARMYAGPGSAPLLAAAAGWDAVATELETTAQTYSSVLSGLASLHWHGPAAVAMMTTARPYIDWMLATAELTRQTGTQARAAATAYELAHAMTVPPVAVATNRIQLATLIATNFFGQNTAAIAATEAQYAEYWAQDAAAMYGYAAGAAAAAELTPFTSPDPTTNPAGLTAQDAAVTHADTGTAAVNTPARWINFSNGGDRSLQALYTALDPSSLFYFDVGILDEVRVVGTAINSTFKFEGFTSGIIGADHDLGILPTLSVPVAPQPPASGPGVSAGLRGITATLADAGRIGPLSVPSGWTVPANEPTAASVVAVSEPGVLPGASSGSSVPGLPGMPGVTVSRPSMVVPRYGRRILAVMGRPPAAG